MLSERSSKVEAAKMNVFSRVGTPDALKGACPVWGGLGGIPLLKGSMDAVLLLHGESHTQEANVAAVNYGKPVSGEPEDPDKPWTTRR
jgi:hypothetical protein